MCGFVKKLNNRNVQGHDCLLNSDGTWGFKWKKSSICPRHALLGTVTEASYEAGIYGERNNSKTKVISSHLLTLFDEGYVLRAF